MGDWTSVIRERSGRRERGKNVSLTSSVCRKISENREHWERTESDRKKGNKFEKSINIANNPKFKRNVFLRINYSVVFPWVSNITILYLQIILIIIYFQITKHHLQKLLGQSSCFCQWIFLHQSCLIRRCFLGVDRLDIVRCMLFQIESSPLKWAVRVMFENVYTFFFIMNRCTFHISSSRYFELLLP